ncbi:hypothetical protein C1752_02017 [Acaryochloris thomasi RCC1774]|uniref:Endoribonuclease YoeB n=1 Tax=Acaryochloris thomasi RCC1774 TaxID=1764569 RepID=A0A2W1K037_9CYAN|nr:Txe/YoeB family addiction module toxin [Acaryochloris thomasi]PZD73667.1 hypothetical protein C1752_02017 [Acaryochloris thomasi RCC1774]
MAWTIEFSRRALKDAKKLRAAGLSGNAVTLLEALKQNPYSPTYEKLSGNLKGYYSRRINIQHHLVYSIDQENQASRVVSLWSHYE